MYKIAVIGDRDSVLGFKALGLHIVVTDDSLTAKEALHNLIKDEYAVIYITEKLALELKNEISRYKDSPIPAIIPIPDKNGSLGFGTDTVRKAVERAVGVNILVN